MERTPSGWKFPSDQAFLRNFPTLEQEGFWALLFVMAPPLENLDQQPIDLIHGTMSNVSYYTAEGLQNLKDEIHHMKTVERPKISQQIAEARDKGDLSENAEYDAAKEAQGMLEAKIAKMENAKSSNLKIAKLT